MAMCDEKGGLEDLEPANNDITRVEETTFFLFLGLIASLVSASCS